MKDGTLQTKIQLFHLPHFNVTDGLDDYDEDFTTFAELGDVVTHEMKRMLEKEKEQSLTLVNDEQQELQDKTQAEKQFSNKDQALNEVSEASEIETEKERYIGLDQVDTDKTTTNS